MSTPAHVLSGAYIGIIVAHIAPHETSYLLTAVTSAGLLDIDHLYYFIRDWKYYQKNGFIGRLHHARSVFHELIGFMLAGTVMFILSFINIKLALVIGIPAMIHVAEDMVMGVSIPFRPADNTKVSLIPQKFHIKIVVDIFIIVIFGLLWIQYLTAAK